MPDLTGVEERTKWEMPDWMEQYRDLFQNTGGNSIERLMNCNVDARVNIVLASLSVACESQVAILTRLHDRGLLAGDDERSTGCR